MRGSQIPRDKVQMGATEARNGKKMQKLRETWDMRWLKACWHNRLIISERLSGQNDGSALPLSATISLVMHALVHIAMTLVDCLGKAGRCIVVLAVPRDI